MHFTHQALQKYISTHDRMKSLHFTVSRNSAVPLFTNATKLLKKQFRNRVSQNKTFNVKLMHKCPSK